MSERKHTNLLKFFFSSMYSSFTSPSNFLGFFLGGSKGTVRRSFGRERIGGETSARGVEQALAYDSHDSQFEWWENKSRNCESQYIDITFL